MMDVQLHDYIPGAIGRITALHAHYYSKHWNFGLFFEAKVAAELAGLLNRFDVERDFFKVAVRDDRIIGGIVIDGSDNREARLRWFIVEEGHQGLGVGRKLMQAAVDHCHKVGFEKVYLWTFAGLDAARRLYEDFGFKLILEHDDDQWGRTVTEQQFELKITP